MGPLRLRASLSLRVSLNLTPRPPPWLTAPSFISSTPASSKAEINFMSESTLPRIVSSLASIRWMVGSESPESSASRRWSMLSSARAARICADVIMRAPSTTRVIETGHADSTCIHNNATNIKSQSQDLMLRIKALAILWI
jgi:hypothetical protein